MGQQNTCTHSYATSSAVWIAPLLTNIFIIICLVHSGDELLHMGSCADDSNNDNCNCPTVIDYVCGTDGNTYNNDCHMTCRYIDK